MNETLDSATSSSAVPLDDSTFRMERRIFRGMCVTLALAVPLTLAFAHWQIGTGLLLGGALALLNYHWLRSSVAAAFGAAIEGAKPNLTIARYFLRYVTIAGAIFAAHKLRIASGLAALFGLSLFGVAALVEAFMQVYFAIIQKED